MNKNISLNIQNGLFIIFYTSYLISFCNCQPDNVYLDGNQQNDKGGGLWVLWTILIIVCATLLVICIVCMCKNGKCKCKCKCKSSPRIRYSQNEDITQQKNKIPEKLEQLGEEKVATKDEDENKIETQTNQTIEQELSKNQTTLIPILQTMHVNIEGMKL